MLYSMHPSGALALSLSLLTEHTMHGYHVVLGHGECKCGADKTRCTLS